MEVVVDVEDDVVVDVEGVVEGFRLDSVGLEEVETSGGCR